ncbi:unnamed protein product [Sympodiomycopsis kandeliae]
MEADIGHNGNASGSGQNGNVARADQEDGDVPATLRNPVALVESDLIYDSHHVLYDVQLAPSASTNNSASSSDGQLRPFTQEELLQARPHPQALFCPATTEWIVLIPTGHITTEQASQGSNHDIFPIYHTSDPFDEDGDVPAFDTIQVAEFAEEQERTSTAYTGPFRVHTAQTSGLVHHDLSQRSFVSARIPSSIPAHLLPSLRNNRRENPSLGQQPDQSFLAAFKTLCRILANASRDDQRHLPLNSPTIQNKIGTDPVAMEIFKHVGLNRSTTDDGREALQATQSDQLLTLRNLLEVITWWCHYCPDQNTAIASIDPAGFGLHVSAIEQIDTPSAYAARHLHWDRHRFEAQESLNMQDGIHPLLRLAMSVMGASWQGTDAVIEKMYRANSQQIQLCPSDIVRQRCFVDLFSALETVRQYQRPNSDILQTLCGMERSQGAYSNDELQESYLVLQCNQTDSDQHLAQQYLSLIDANSSSHQQCRRARDALGMINASRCAPSVLQQAYDRPLKMTIEEAYSALQIPAEDPNSVEDSMIITLFEMHVCEETTNVEKVNELRRALQVIADSRNSKLLQRFHQTGDSNVQVEGNVDIPTGLNNIGNTCYLNSVLQYFFAIKPLRDRVLALQPECTLSEKKPVVGGRKTTSHEVKRSLEFINGLKGLFGDMISTNSLAVTPSRELAYLALVSTRFDADADTDAAQQQEENGLNGKGVITEEPGQIGSDEQNTLRDRSAQPANNSVEDGQNTLGDRSARSVDATQSSVSAQTAGAVVDNASMPAQAVDANNTSGSAQAGVDNASMPAEEDTAMLDEEQIIPPQPGFSLNKRKSSHDDQTAKRHLSTHSNDQIDQAQAQAVVNEDDGIATPPLPSAPLPPALPPRPNASPTSTSTAAAAAAVERRNSLMTLGAQQDVSECLDNVLFQIEVALHTTAPTHGSHGRATAQTGGSQAHTTSPASQDQEDTLGQVSRLFTGKTRQVVTNAQSPSSGTTHIKNEIFTILPIDVSEEESGRDIYDGLDGFFEEEILSSDGGGPAAGQPQVKRSVTLLEPPPILQIQLQRVQYDRIRGAYKSQARLEMGDELYMDRYLDFSELEADEEELNLLNTKREEALRLRKEMASIGARLRELRPKFGDSSIDTLKKTQSVLKGLGQVKSVKTLQKEYSARHSPPQPQAQGQGQGEEEENLIDLSSSSDEDEEESDPNSATGTDLTTLLSDSLSLDTFLKSESSALSSEITNLEYQLRLLKTQTESLWSSHKSCRYKLISIFKHRGEASHGHYFLEQKKKDDEWFKYNDSVVQEVTLKEVLHDTTGATPYLLSYVRQDEDVREGEELFESLKREPAQIAKEQESNLSPIA